jgi:glycerate-2-kinase
MARATEELLGDRIFGGLVVAKEGHEAPLGSLETIIASHPEPDEAAS